MDAYRLLRGGALGLAVIALAFALLGRVCTASENHAVSHDGPQAACCVMLDEASVLAVQQLPDLKHAPAIVWRIAPAHQLIVAASWPALRPPGAASSKRLAYHARSARILS